MSGTICFGGVCIPINAIWPVVVLGLKWLFEKLTGAPPTIEVALDERPVEQLPPVPYVGSDEVPSAQAGQNLWIETGFTGDTFFATAIQELSGLADAVVDPTDPAASTAAFLDTLDDALHDITSARTTVGLTMQRAEDALTASESLQLSLAQQLDQTDLNHQFAFYVGNQKKLP